MLSPGLATSVAIQHVWGWARVQGEGIGLVQNQMFVDRESIAFPYLLRDEPYYHTAVGHVADLLGGVTC